MSMSPVLGLWTKSNSVPLQETDDGDDRDDDDATEASWRLPSASSGTEGKLSTFSHLSLPTNLWGEY